MSLGAYWFYVGLVSVSVILFTVTCPAVDDFKSADVFRDIWRVSIVAWAVVALYGTLGVTDVQTIVAGYAAIVILFAISYVLVRPNLWYEVVAAFAIITFAYVAGLYFVPMVVDVRIYGIPAEDIVIPGAVILSIACTYTSLGARIWSVIPLDKAEFK